jgi:hypothetical protein
MIDIVTAAALVAAFVGVAKAQGMPTKYSQPAALLLATVYVLIPANAQEVVATIAAIALGAGGVHSLTKKKDGVK